MDQGEYDRIREAWKDHYRSILRLKKKLGGLRYTEQVNRALEQMNPENVMENFDLALLRFREKMALAEARISAALQGTDEEKPDAGEESFADTEEELRRIRAKQTLEELKNQVGMLQQEVETKARSMKITKTIGSSGRTTKEKTEAPAKTIGIRRDTKKQ